MTPVRKFRGTRALLNKTGFSSTGAIACEIEDTREWGVGRNHKGKVIKADDYVASPDYIFQIANCDRSISFELEFDTEESMENNLYKLDTMIQVLKEFREAVADEQVLHKARQRRAGRHKNA